MTGVSLDYYATPGRFTTLRETQVRDAAVTGGDVAAVVDVVQGILVYDVVAKDVYGADLSPAQAGTIHERDAAVILDTVSAIAARPLSEPRPPTNRVGGRCHTYAKLTVALLRAAGVPARARCGFGAAFVAGRLEDHWVAEYWNGPEGRWAFVDAQLDVVWRRMIDFDADPLDLPTGTFVTAGHAWQAWRRGELDAETCGLSEIGEQGAHWIAGNLRLDLAALNKVEMLPWDVWGAAWGPEGTPSDELLDALDAVAAMNVDPEAAFDELHARYGSDERFRMDGTVFNVLRNAFETV